MRTTRPHVKRWKWGGESTKWVVDGLRDENGKRIRRFFASRDDANEWLAQRRPELKNQGRAALGLTDSQRVDAINAIKILAPFGANLTAAAKVFAERAQLLERTVTFAKLREETVEAKRSDRMSAHYVNDLARRLKRFGADFDERQVATIEGREVDDWLRGLGMSPTSRINYRKILHTAFQFAVARGYSKSNPVEGTTKPKVDHPSPGILTPREIAALLPVADARIVPWVAVAAFAGLRDAEIGRLTWDKVDLAAGYVRVDAAIAKTSSRRLVPVSANLRAWLAPHAQKSGPIRGAKCNAYPLLQAARLAAVEALKKANEPATNLESWPHNALRHSFASYRMALVTNAAQVAEECGHSVQVMKTHYRELVTKTDADKWFAVMPVAAATEVSTAEVVAVPENVVAFERAAGE